MQNQNSPDARGARWISDHATHFLFFVDREALAGPNSGKVRQDTQVLARILSEQRENRPLIVVWTKNDMPCPTDVVQTMADKLKKLFGEHSSFHVSSKESTCLEILKLILAPKPATPFQLLSQPTTYSAFSAYRGSRS
jgi:hypothetical protein